MSAEFLLSPRDETQGHEGSIPRRVRFVDTRERNTRELQTSRNGAKCSFVRNRKDERMRPFRKVPGTAFSRRVDQHRGLNSSGQVRPHEDVMRKRILVRVSVAGEVAGRSRFEGNSGITDVQKKKDRPGFFRDGPGKGDRGAYRDQGKPTVSAFFS